MLNSRQRAFLRGMANDYETIIQIGKGGISPALIKTVSEALYVRELIKIKVHSTAPEDIRTIANQVAEQSESEIVHIIGSKIILYKHSDNKDITPIKLVK
ncbi:MAG: YhbY family RNA-binding protein [Ruminococcaceae bacterium]|nr:YhbY family RNA-binding protein [Oscillospiraceae bacterium]